MKIRPKIIAASQKFAHGGGGVGSSGGGGADSIYKFHSGCNGTQKSSNCAGTPLWSCSSATTEDDCFSRITVCEINCSHSRSSSISNSSTNSSTTNSNHRCYTTAAVNGGSNSFNMATIANTKNMNISSDKNNHVYAYALISFIAVMVYLNGINGNFVHDDIPAISMNKDVIGVNKITRSFFNDFWGTPMDDVNSHKSYRPLTVLSFR